MHSHLTLADWAKWLSGRLEHAEMLAKVVPHLNAHCAVCGARYAELRRLQEEVGHWDEEVAVLEGSEAPRLLAELDELPYEERLRKVRNEGRYHSWALCQLLLRKSRETAFEDPSHAVDQANVAIEVSRHLGDAYDPHWVLDLQARAYAYLGHARRLLGELRSAEDAFAEAERKLGGSETGNRLVEAELSGLRGSLRLDQRRFTEALELVSSALAIHRAERDARGVSRMLLKQAKILEEAGQLKRAIEVLEGELPAIDAAANPRLSAYARFNLLVCLTQAGRHREAEALLPLVRERLQASGQPFDLVRLRWSEGAMHLGLGRGQEAEDAFREVQRAFLERGMGYDAALVSLDLAVLYAQEGRTDDLKRLAEGLVAVFESRDVHREAIAALIMFQHACERERLTVQLARHLAGFLRRERRRPPAVSPRSGGASWSSEAGEASEAGADHPGAGDG